MKIEMGFVRKVENHHIMESQFENFQNLGSVMDILIHMSLITVGQTIQAR